MLKKYRNGFIPAALVCLGVEHAPGSLPCQAGVNKDKECNPYEVNIIKAKSSQTISHLQQESFSVQDLYNTNRPKANKLYNRKANKDSQTITRRPTSLTIYDVINKKEAKTLVKAKDKDINLKSYNKENKSVAKSTASEVKSENTYTYVVKEGDTLSLIAKEFGLNLKRLLKLNNLSKNSPIKVGQKLKLPKNSMKIAKAKTNKRFHIVKRGDTLSSIAKEYNIELNKLLKYNNLTKDDHIKIGQKIYFSPQRAKAKVKIAKKFKAKKMLKVTATAYTSHRSQTDKTPFLAAWNNKIRPGMKIIAVSRDLIKKYGLTNGVKVKIKGLPGIYTVRDKMNKKFKRRIDIYMGLNKKRALQWGKRKITLLIIK